MKIEEDTPNSEQHTIAAKQVVNRPCSVWIAWAEGCGKTLSKGLWPPSPDFQFEIARNPEIFSNPPPKKTPTKSVRALCFNISLLSYLCCLLP